MTRRRTAAESLEAWMAAQFSGDRATCNAIMDPGFVLVEPVGLPYAGTYRGPDGYWAFFDKFLATWTDLDASVERVFENTAGDELAIIFRIKARSARTGRAIDTTLMEHWKFRDGRLVSIAPHNFDTAQLAAVTDHKPVFA